ncbi:methyltransferase domain-containing protein [Erythrobacter vulgaris]|uniref:Methyltransferase domain-containing protein n=1 Tax=Qipengyuania vulgaris TaxID=291985 RepID=A0A844XPJ6_9SPHN|nr:class I SAM-dependent methyltransferase [Qipengyuania vulgaris]MXO47163.1 methyltransferase domain-containing protein [Qipengyuania vulgaris]
MDRVEKEKAWKAFWERQQSSTAGSVVSSGPDPITRAQFDAWADFSAHLKQGARVLDLGTGGGKLAKILLQARPDLSIVGIDLSSPLPAAPDGIELIGGISMENLPFPDSHFDAAVSQFGFEYGDTDLISDEILRVVKTGSSIGLMVHLGGGPILAHNLKRKEQILWVKVKKGLFDYVKEMLHDEDSDRQAAIGLAQNMAVDGAARFGKGSVAWELPEAVRRTLIMAQGGAHENLVATLDLISDQAEAELGRIASLADACAAADNREHLLVGFQRQGRLPIETVSVRLPGEPAFAELIIM